MADSEAAVAVSVRGSDSEREEGDDPPDGPGQYCGHKAQMHSKHFQFSFFFFYFFYFFYSVKCVATSGLLQKV
jgi:hypothetical protein